MTKPQTQLLFVIMLLALVSAANGQETAPTQEAAPIRNFLRVNDQFCTGGQPKLEQLEKLKADGVKAIINLRQPSEHRAADEEAKAKELGLRYFNIPVAYADPKEEQVTEFLKITDDPENRPAFVHCTGAIRVGAFWMIRRVLRDGWSIKDAEAEAEKISQFVEASAHEVASKKEQPESVERVLNKLKQSVEKFEASHPQLTSFVTEYSAALSNLGF